MFLPILLLALVADVRGCVCDPARPETMQGRECGLTKVASEAPAGPGVVMVHDANPTKPHRWLAMPHSLQHTLNDMTAEERTAYWNAAIEKARSLWGGDWGIAVNGLEKRTQCELHAHIGKLSGDADVSGGLLVSGPAEIPMPKAGLGIWIHPEGSKLRVHSDQEAGELMLER